MLHSKKIHLNKCKQTITLKREKHRAESLEIFYKLLGYDTLRDAKIF